MVRSSFATHIINKISLVSAQKKEGNLRKVAYEGPYGGAIFKSTDERGWVLSGS
ncbi:hypothetical protein BVI2075_200053 [Burkholderia vietnamiensis]|nr:hypothetical protein BVI2075_200053 [Burkholderia vietnamiensis]